MRALTAYDEVLTTTGLTGYEDALITTGLTGYEEVPFIFAGYDGATTAEEIFAEYG